jgi:cytidylate kinase
MAGDHADLRYWLDAPLDVRAARIADREDTPVERAREETATREDSEAGRYRDYYGIDIDNLTIYDLVLNTARWGPAGVVDLLALAATAHEPAGDEGAAPVSVEYDFV